MLCLWWLQVTPVATVNNILSINAVQSVTPLSSRRSVFALTDFSYSISPTSVTQPVFLSVERIVLSIPPSPFFLSPFSVPPSIPHHCVALSHSSRLQLDFSLHLNCCACFLGLGYGDGLLGRLSGSHHQPHLFVCFALSILPIVCERLLVKLCYDLIFVREMCDCFSFFVSMFF